MTKGLVIAFPSRQPLQAVTEGVLGGELLFPGVGEIVITRNTAA